MGRDTGFCRALIELRVELRAGCKSLTLPLIQLALYFNGCHVDSAITYRAQVFFKLIRSWFGKVWNLGPESNRPFVNSGQ